MDKCKSKLFIFQEVEITLFHLPKPTKHHLDTLEQLLLNVEKDFSLSTPDLQARGAIAAKLDAVLKQCIAGALNCSPWCNLRQFFQFFDWKNEADEAYLESEWFIIIMQHFSATTQGEDFSLNYLFELGPEWVELTAQSCTWTFVVSGDFHHLYTAGLGNK